MCTEEDYDLFYPVDPNYFEKLENLKSGDKGNLYCIDQTDEFKIFGEWTATDFLTVTMDLVPCNYMHTHLGYEGDSISDDCIADLDQQTAFLGAIDFTLFVNNSSFD